MFVSSRNSEMHCAFLANGVRAPIDLIYRSQTIARPMSRGRPFSGHPTRTSIWAKPLCRPGVMSASSRGVTASMTFSATARSRPERTGTKLTFIRRLGKACDDAT